MADEANILGADGLVKQSSFAAAPGVATEVKIFDAGGDLVLSGATAEAVQAALNSFAKRGSKIVSAVSLVGKRWVAACSVPPITTGLDTTQTLNLADVVRVDDADGTRMLSGPSASAVEFALNRCIELGARVVSPVGQMGQNWVAACTVPTNAILPGVAQAPAQLDDGCRVEAFGFKHIVYGPSRLSVQIRVAQILQRGAKLVGEIQLEGDEWTAVCDTGGYQNADPR